MRIEARYAKWEEKAKAWGVGKSLMGILSFAKEVNDLTPFNQFIKAHKVAWESRRNVSAQHKLKLLEFGT